MGGPEAPRHRCLLGPRVLHVLGLVEDGHCPVDGTQHGAIAPEHPVRGDDDGLGLGRGEGIGRPGASAPVMAHDGQGGREPGQLTLPVPDDGHRAHDEGGPPIVGIRLAAREQERDGLHGLAQAHVVGQAATEAEVGHGVEPAQSPHLVGAQRAVEVRRHRGVAAAVSLAQLLQHRGQAPLGHHVHLRALALG